MRFLAWLRSLVDTWTARELLAEGNYMAHLKAWHANSPVIKPAKLDPIKKLQARREVWHKLRRVG